MNDAFATDFEAMGLSDHSPFDILSRPRAEVKTPAIAKKRGPKASNHIAKTLAALRDPDAGNKFNTPIMTRAESDRTLAIQGAPC